MSVRLTGDSSIQAAAPEHCDNLHLHEVVALGLECRKKILLKNWSHKSFKKKINIYIFNKKKEKTKTKIKCISLLQSHLAFLTSITFFLLLSAGPFSSHSEINGHHYLSPFHKKAILTTSSNSMHLQRIRRSFMSTW